MLGFGPRRFRDDLMSPVRFHRILRRGREYGPELLPEDAIALAPANDPERGLQFLCLNANIFAPVRVPPERLDQYQQVFRVDRGDRSAARKPGAGSWMPGDLGIYPAAGKRNSAARLGLAAVRHPAWRRLFLSPQPARFALLRRSWESPALIGRSDFRDRVRTPLEIQLRMNFPRKRGARTGQQIPRLAPTS